MSKLWNSGAAAFLAASLCAGVSAAQATTIDFDGVSNGLNADLGGGFIAEDIRIVNGNCASNECAALNTNGPTGGRLDLMTIRMDDNSAFSIDSFWFQRLGMPSALTVITSAMTSASEYLVFDSSNTSNNQGITIDTELNALFQDITFISFDNNGTGNVRVDDIVAADDMTPVPLPAAGWLLFAGIGGLVAAGRRKKA